MGVRVADGGGAGEVLVVVCLEARSVREEEAATDVEARVSLPCVA